MSQDFGIENTGGGFDFDDDEDLESMFNKANEGEETSDEDNHLSYIFDDEQPQEIEKTSTNEEYSQEPVAETHNAWEVVPQENEETPQATVGQNVPTYDETTEISQEVDFTEFEEYKSPEEENVQNSENDQYSEPVVEQAPVQETPAHGRRISSDYNSAYSSHSAGTANTATEPVQVPSEQVYQTHVAEPVAPSRRLNITTEQEDIDSVRKTIRILDAYRKLNSKSIVAQLIYNENDVDPQDEAALVVKVLRSDPMLSKMMTVLRESASEKDRVERVFYILNIEQDVLRYLGSFLETVSDVSFDSTQNHIAFAKEVERAIETLDSKIVQHVVDAQSVLAAAEDEKE